jgi:hypothetical protein
MPVVIGMMQKTFANPVGLLSDCHRRIESFLSMLLALASHADGALDTELPNALETALKYFREAAPMHTAESSHREIEEIGQRWLRQEQICLQEGTPCQVPAMRNGRCRMHGGHLRAHKLPRAWTVAGMQTGNTAGTRRRRSIFP